MDIAWTLLEAGVVSVGKLREITFEAYLHEFWSFALVTRVDDDAGPEGVPFAALPAPAPRQHHGNHQAPQEPHGQKHADDVRARHHAACNTTHP